MATRKKDLQEPDEFLEALRRAYKYTMENIKFISVIAGGILAGVVIIVLIFYQIRLNKTQESSLMNQAMAAYHAGEADAALASLDKFSGKDGLAGSEAALYQGNILYDEGKYGDALKSFERARDLSENRDLLILRGLAFQGMAYCALALKDTAKAEEAFKAMGEAFQDLSLLELGRLYASQGDRTNASRVLTQLINDFPDSPWVPAAERLKD